MRNVFLTLASGFILLGCQASETTPPPTEAPAMPAAPKSPETRAMLPAGKVDEIDFKSYSKELANRIGLIEGETRLDAIDKIRLYFAPEPGTNMVNLTSSTFELDDGSVMLFARNNLPDDSVFAEEVYAVFSGPGEAKKFKQSLAAYGLRIKCRRGDNAMEWTTELCP
jgi:hypothetical protein